MVLSLLDQLYATRRRMRLLCTAIEQAGSEDLRDAILRHYREHLGPAGA